MGADLIHDASGWADWGEISWDENLPPGTDIVIQTKTSLDNLNWSDWSDNYTNPAGGNITSPAGRYIQYQAILGTENLSLTPELREVRITWPAADANVRVAEDVVRVAVILAEPNDVEHDFPTERFKERVAQNFVRYWDEVSYGALATRVEVYDNGGEWYQLNKPSADYITDRNEEKWRYTYEDKFVMEAISIHADPDIDFSPYTLGNKSAVIVVGAESLPHPYRIRAKALGYRGLLGWWWVEAFTEHGKVSNLALVSEIDWQEVWAHELTHVLGRILREGDDPMPELYPEGNTMGDVDGWDVMGRDPEGGHRAQVHLSSWSKERLGWLGYEPINWVGTGRSYWESWVDALPTLGYHGRIYNHRVIDREEGVYMWTALFGYTKVATLKAKIDYLLEVRTENEAYSQWDTGVPGSGLVLYKVGTAEVHTWLKHDSRTWVSVPGGDRPFTENRQPDPTEGGVQFRVLERDPPLPVEEPRRMRISAQRATENQLWTIMFQVPFRLPENTLLSDTSVWPDLDLHAYTPDGRHVGVNYETGEYEIGVEGALASGDYINGSEWIRLPAGVEAYFTVSGHDAEEFLLRNPGVQLENGIYMLISRYHDNRGERYESAIAQVIEPGAEISNLVNVVQNPDGTYSVGVELGIDMFNLDMWHFVVDNLPDNIFIKNPAQRKNALKEKFEGVFEELEEAEEDVSENDTEDAGEHYREAAEKLANDILEKLNADGKADWVREPVLVNELKAFITTLGHKAGNGDDG